MNDRIASSTEFIARAGWGDAVRRRLAGDASNRKYDRLTRANGETAVLMDAPPATGEDIRPFLRIDGILAGYGLSPPQVYAQDEEQGFLLLEDLGDALFARVLERQPALETALYEAAVDVLSELHRHPAPADLARYDAARMADMAALAYDWYLPGATDTDPQGRAGFHACVTALGETLARSDEVLIQRDYHAENLIWLPERSGAARVGLLDFQDAMAGHRGYDLVSLLQDARRDVADAVEQAMLSRYIDENRLDESRFLAAYAFLGAQRNLRILGVFARLSMLHGKPGYVALIPRVWNHLMRDLRHPALADLRGIVETGLPAPTDAGLDRIREKCGTSPKP